jgi:hypothetical protein
VSLPAEGADPAPDATDDESDDESRDALGVISTSAPLLRALRNFRKPNALTPGAITKAESDALRTLITRGLTSEEGNVTDEFVKTWNKSASLPDSGLRCADQTVLTAAVKRLLQRDNAFMTTIQIRQQVKTMRQQWINDTVDSDRARALSPDE